MPELTATKRARGLRMLNPGYLVLERVHFSTPLSSTYGRGTNRIHKCLPLSAQKIYFANSMLNKHTTFWLTLVISKCIRVNGDRRLEVQPSTGVEAGGGQFSSRQGLQRLPREGVVGLSLENQEACQDCRVTVCLVLVPWPCSQHSTSWGLYFHVSAFTKQRAD